MRTTHDKPNRTRERVIFTLPRKVVAHLERYARIVRGGNKSGFVADAIEAYIWGDRELASWRCKACGCLTHGTLVGTPSEIRSVNARMFVQFDPASVTIHRSDNGHTGWFWTRPDAPIWPASYPPSDPSESDDWR